MIIGRGHIVSPETVTVQLEVQMTVGEMHELHAAMKDKPYWPFGKFGAVLADVIRQVEKTAYATGNDELK